MWGYNCVKFKSYCLVPSPVEDALVTLVDEMVNVTWSPPANPNGVIHQYIVQRMNSSGTFYYHVPAKQYHTLLPAFNDALIFVSAVNLFGSSELAQAKPNSMFFMIVLIQCYVIFLFAATCLPSPCINNGRCVAVTTTNQQLLCNCIGIYSGTFCENSDKVCK